MKHKILVIGESCKDVFVYCEALRLCPDVPVPVLNIQEQTENPGMANNVFQNIQSLLGQCDLVTNPNWTTITKTRYVDQKSNHMFVRVDSPCHIKRINLKKIDLDYEFVVISDYNRGFLHEEDIQEICSRNNRVFIDTKKNLGTWLQDAFYIKINNYEYENSKNLPDSIKNKIIRTMGSDGCEHLGVKFPVVKVDVKDVSGAGDTFMAALVVQYFKTRNIWESIRFANQCASTVVKYRGVTIITPDLNHNSSGITGSQ